MNQRLILNNVAWITALTSFYLIAQGPLVPSGGPTPSMKTLQQVEPRTDIDTLGASTQDNHWSITEPGSYYLTHSLPVSTLVGIRVEAPDVTIDLNGFRIEREDGSAGLGGVAIQLAGEADGCVIKNGFIRGEFTDGITMVGGTVNHVRIENVSVTNCKEDGIDIFSGSKESSIVSRCQVRDVGQTGISAGVVSECIVGECRGTAINGLLVRDSRGASDGTNTADNGIVGINVVNCQGSSQEGTGIQARTVRDSNGSSFGGTGINGKMVSNSYGSSAKGKGIIAKVVTGSEGFSSGHTAIDTEIADASLAQSALNLEFLPSAEVDGERANPALYAIQVFNCRGAQTAPGVDPDEFRVRRNGIQSRVVVASSGNGKLNGIAGDVVASSLGEGTVGSGIQTFVDNEALELGGRAKVVTGSYGTSENDIGIYSDVVESSYGFAQQQVPAIGSILVKGSYGSSTGDTTAIDALKSAIGCEVSPGNTVDAPKKFLGTP